MHFILVGLTRHLEEGQTYPLELDFENADIVKVVVSIMRSVVQNHKVEPSSMTLGSNVHKQ